MSCCGCCSSKNVEVEEPVPKEGFLYEKVRSKFRPLDLILFRGSDFVSDTIRTMCNTRLSKTWADNYSHAGVVVTSEILDHPEVKEGVIYVWESTISGKLGQNVYNISGESFLGTQLRNFDDLVIEYDKPNTTSVALCQLNNNPANSDDFDKKKALRKEFTEVFTKYNGVRYDLNFLSLLSALYPPSRCVRPLEKVLGTQNWLFCSELCALVYKRLNLLPGAVNEKNVLPVDFINGVDEDKAIPKNFVKYPLRVVTKAHYEPENFMVIGNDI